MILFSHNIFFFNDTATTEIYTLSLHDALPIWRARQAGSLAAAGAAGRPAGAALALRAARGPRGAADRRALGRPPRRGGGGSRRRLLRARRPLAAGRPGGRAAAPRAGRGRVAAD